MSRQGEIETYYTARGLPRYQMEIWHDELNKYQLIKGTSQSEVHEKASSKVNSWDEMWRKKSQREIKKENIQHNKDEASRLTSEAQSEIEELRTLLTDMKLLNWNSLKRRRQYRKKAPVRNPYPNYPYEPVYPPQPQMDDLKYRPKIGLLDELFSSRKRTKIQEKENLFHIDISNWNEEINRLQQDYNNEVEKIHNRIALIDKKYQEDVVNYNKEKEIYLKQVDKDNNAILLLKEQCDEGDVESLELYFSSILNKSNYPGCIDINFEIEYNPTNKIFIIDYQLPSPDEIPNLKEVKYIQSRDEFDEKYLSKSEFNKLYDDILYQIPLRVTSELYNADEMNSIDSIVFNGFVNSINPSTGVQSNSCISSLQTQKDDFIKLNLECVDPKSCFKKFKGIGSAKLHTITAIKPILDISKEDRRFVQSYDVENTLEEGYNIAAMDWKDFENLVREIFEKEFAKNGGEVKVTQSSRDGGVDAIAFDNDPIRGGKIVIQAKRYTNTVGLSAVRDLFGTVMNEGAMKGILITTADYGPDAYDFAKDKPLSLLNGGHLLHMLREHGHTVKIDLHEAKAMLSGEEDVMKW